MTNFIRGNKHTCLHCDTRFYDLNKRPATCPGCNRRVSMIREKMRYTTRKVKVPAPSPRKSAGSV